jgi:hypothetical protein
MGQHDPKAEVMLQLMLGYALRSQLAYTDLRGIMACNA